MGVRFDVPSLFIHVDAQDAGKEILGDLLAVSAGVVLIAFVPEGNVEISVGAELQRAAVVVVVVVRLFDQDQLGRGIGGVWISRQQLEAGKPLVKGAAFIDRIENEKVTVARVIRVKRQP